MFFLCYVRNRNVVDRKCRKRKGTFRPFNVIADDHGRYGFLLINTKEVNVGIAIFGLLCEGRLEQSRVVAKLKDFTPFLKKGKALNTGSLIKG